MNRIYDIIIIGGGTAGMTAAIYAHRAGRDVLIIEKAFLGGQIINAAEVANYPSFATSSGYDFANSIASQINDMNIARTTDTVIAIRPHSSDRLWRVIGSSQSYEAGAVIIAVGTEQRRLGLEGEEKFLGSGLSYCATCDGAFYRNRKAAVVGGGNSAMEEAVYLSSICSDVYLIYRHNELAGERSLRDNIERLPNIHRIPSTDIIGLHGRHKLERIELSGRDGHARVLTIDGLFVAIGQIPRNECFADTVQLDSSGYILAYDDCHTNRQGIFAAGDCRSKDFRQLVTAAADGAMAAAEASRYLDLSAGTASGKSSGMYTDVSSDTSANTSADASARE